MDIIETPGDRFQALLEIGRSLSSEKELDRLMVFILGRITPIMEAERSSLFFLDNENDVLWSKIAQGMGASEISIPIGVGIAGLVAKTGELINVPDVCSDPRFNPDVDSKSGFSTRSLLCAPMFDKQGEVLGVIQVLNKLENKPFTQEDENILEAISSLAAVAIDNAKLSDALQDMKQHVQKMNRDLQESIPEEAKDEAYNPPYFTAWTQRETQLAARYGTSVSLLHIDVAPFHEQPEPEDINVICGSVAHAILESSRETDFLARHTNKHFAILAPFTNFQQAEFLARRIQSKVKKIELGKESVSESVDVSIGIANWHPDMGGDVKELFRQAELNVSKMRSQPASPLQAVAN